MRMRRHTEPTFGSWRTAPWGRFARDIGLVLLTFVVGYAASVYWITPGSVTGDEHAVPRVLDRPLEEARATLTKAGFRSRIEGDRPSPSVPRGGVALAGSAAGHGRAAQHGGAALRRAADPRRPRYRM